MPLKSGKSQKTIAANIKELMKKPGRTRSKAIKTIANKDNLTESQAKQKQAVAIALSNAKLSKK